MQLVSLDEIRYAFPTFQYRKRYGLHAIGWTEIATPFTDSVSIPQAVWTACNNIKKKLNEHLCISFNTASGMDCMQCATVWRIPTRGLRFNTASGMDCMQYCLPEPLKTVNPKGGFLVRPPFLRFSPNLGEFFCRKKRFKRGAKPDIPRKLLSTRKT